MPTLPHHLSRHRLARLLAAVPRLRAVLESLDRIDRKAPLAPAFAGPRYRTVSEVAALLGRTPFQPPRRPMPAELFIAAMTIWIALDRLLERWRRSVNRHAYPRSSTQA